MQEPSSLKELFQCMAPEAMGILTGRVSSADPLEITAVNNKKLVLGRNLLCLPGHLSSYKVKVDIKGAGEDMDMTVHNGLKKGEIVALLSFNHGKKYYVLDREG